MYEGTTLNEARLGNLDSFDDLGGYGKNAFRRNSMDFRLQHGLRLLRT